MYLILEVELKLCKVHGRSGFFGECFRWIPWVEGLLYLPTSVGMILEAQLGAMEQTIPPAPSFSFEKD